MKRLLVQERKVKEPLSSSKILFEQQEMDPHMQDLKVSAGVLEDEWRPDSPLERL